MNKGLDDPARAYEAQSSQTAGDDAKTRFAPADNLYDAIRSDIAGLGIVEFRPLLRVRTREYPFNDIDLSPFEDE